MTRARWIGVVAAAIVLIAAGCSDDGDTVSVTGTPAPTTTAASTTTTTTAGGGGGAGGSGAATATTSPSGAAAEAATVTIAQTQLGEVLADADGRTLYVFTRDTPGVSNCTDACLQAWPRYAPPAVVPADGVDAEQLGTITVDGVQQVTIDGLPLYLFASDGAPGDVNGQGVGGNWFVVRPDGTLVR